MYLSEDHDNLLGLRRTTPPTILERGLETTSPRHLKKPLSQPLQQKLV